jgi:hypothetical protein
VYIFAAIGFFLVVGYIAVKFGWTNTSGIIDTQNETFFQQGVHGVTEKNLDTSWTQTEEWHILKAAIIKDQSVIKKAASDADISPRLLVAQLVVEQLRLYNSNREIFEQVFAPLKILGNQSQFSWGIMGLKQETAIEIEEHLKDTTSPFYLGPTYQTMLDFTSENHDQERFERIVNEHDHSWSYLYASLFIKQIETQWQKAGFDISQKPEIVSTLYNIGFARSIPKADPKVGGAEIMINGTAYSFGSLAFYFYYSQELRDQFPIETM